MSWRVIQASVAGTSHHKECLPCQDSCFATTYHGAGGNEILSIVVADGAGSAAFGGQGAELACETCQFKIEEWVNQSQGAAPQEFEVVGWIDAVRAALAESSSRMDVTPRDFACTLLIAVVTPVNATYAHIGDGGIVVDDGAGLRTVFWPESGEYANMTRFVTDDDALKHVRIEALAGAPEELAVFTDGIQRLALDYRSNSVHVPFFNPMLAALRQQESSECDLLDNKLSQFLASDKVNSRTDDDKTLVLATRRIDP